MGGEEQRPRALAWGGEPERAALLAIAEDIRKRAGFKVCAVEVLRADSMLEFVAIAGSDDGGQDLLGQASPLDAMHTSLVLGADYDAFTFVAAEWMTDTAMDMMARYGHIPVLPESELEDAWRAEDMLAARILDAHGELRGILYLDEPVSGRRPTPEEFLALTPLLALPMRAIQTNFERERLVSQVRVARSASVAIRSMSSQMGLGEFLAAARKHLSEGFRATDLQFRLFEGGHALSPPPVDTDLFHDPDNLDALDDAARRSWDAQTAVIVEEGAVWGDSEVAALIGTQLDDHLHKIGAAALVLVPIGAARQALGFIWVTRRTLRWTEAESLAALEVGHDLGRAVVNARAFAREEQLVRELQQLDQYRTQLIATITHELKNPIGALAGHLELIDMQLEDDQPVPDSVSRSLTSMNRSVRRLSSLAADLLELTRLGQSSSPLEPRPVPMDELVADVVSGFEVETRRFGVALSYEADAGAVVAGDAGELEMLMTNLVSNALKYTDRGGTAVVEVIRDGDRVVVTCADSGIGISESDLELIFGEFHRSGDPRARQRPGSGLGLAIAKRIVARHGGSISVQSEEDVGTTFTVELPLLEPAWPPLRPA